MECVTSIVHSKEGRELASRFDQTRDQRHYSGLVKPREAQHDAAIYRMFQTEAARIRADGGEVTKVVLDYELKARVFGAASQTTGIGGDAGRSASPRR